MKKIQIHTLGFPRIGARRELMAALDSHGRGDSSEGALQASARQLRARHWALQADSGLDLVSVGDFSLYDQVADHSALFGCAPALSMGKWFDTDEHYPVPEFDAATGFSLHGAGLLAQVDEAMALGHAVKAALIGPLTFLWLGKAEGGIDKLGLLEQLLPVYCALLSALKERGVSWVQIDEPILGLELTPQWRQAFEPAYWRLAQAGARLMLASYSPLGANLGLACRLPVAGLHVDGVQGRHELISVCDWLALPKVLSVGIVDASSIGRAEFDAALCVLRPLLERRRGQLWLAPSCSLLQAPLGLRLETERDADLKGTLAFAKLDQLMALKAALAQADGCAGEHSAGASRLCAGGSGRAHGSQTSALEMNS